jgi:GGDEF domain-containing protein
MPEDLDLESTPFIFLCSTGPAHEPGHYLDLNQYFNNPFDPIALATLAQRTIAYRKSLIESAQADATLSVVARKVLRKEVLRELNRVQRYGGYVSLCIFDIREQQTEKSPQAQHIEPIVLDRIADILPGMLRTVDLLARLTRRRFLWIMPGADDQRSQLAVQRLATTFAELPICKEHSLLAMHAGLATAPDDGLSYEELLELAQQELTQRPIVPAQPDPQQIAGK